MIPLPTKATTISPLVAFISLLGWTASADQTERQLIDTAVKRVGETISEATSADGTWASQPGAISTFRPNENADGRPAAVHKLYSSPQPIVPDKASLANDIPADWNQSPAHFVDLNQSAAIVDPSLYNGAADENTPEGFSYEERVAGTELGKSLPMPVRWLYQLKDGTVGHLDASNRFVGDRKASAANPIVGRVAYWTDDLTTRVNINTASEGVYWDTPRANSVEERHYATFQPAYQEFQRYPGHPAMTCLSSVLHPGKRYYLPGTDGALAELTLEEAKDLWEATPGVVPEAGSIGGTQKLDLDAERPPRNTRIRELVPGVLHGSINAMPLSAETKARAEKSAFFLTTDSRSPDITATGYPKVSMWPIPTWLPSSKSSNFDRYQAIVSEVNDAQFAFQRNHATSRHNELYGNANGENYRLFFYLQALSNQTFPGYGASFRTKYGAGRFDDRDNILAQMLSYLRGTNLSNPLVSATNQYIPASNSFGDHSIDHGHVAANCFCGGTSVHANRWHRVERPPALGVGRRHIISEVALVVVCRAEKSARGTFGSAEDLAELPENTKLLDFGLTVERFSVMHGWTSLRSKMLVKFVRGEDPDLADRPPLATANGTPLVLSDNAVRSPRVRSTYPDDWVGWGGQTGIRTQSEIATFDPITVPANATSVQLSIDKMRALVFDVDGGTSTQLPSSSLLQSYHLEFPATSLPVPDFHEGTDNTLAARLKSSKTEGAAAFIRAEHDVVRSLVPNHGDYRIINGSRVVDRDVFVPHPDYDTPKKMAHSLVDGDKPVPGATFPQALLPGANYADAPDFPADPSSENYAQDQRETRGPVDPAITGDFDTGVGPAVDGAYSNKPDDGDVRGLADVSGVPYFDNLSAQLELAPINYSPHRAVQSPGAFGSLSTGIKARAPWNTLLFRPMDPDDHYGAQILPDHLWMDYFRMPIIAPYAISDQLSTDGKVNLNYEIQPFTYIKRPTALHALFKAEKVMAIPTAAADRYKTQINTDKWRHFIDAGETLEQWEEKFASGKIFVHASEICEQYLVPEGEQWSKARMKQFWKTHALTGDNVKERPYTNLYPRTTTRSNAFEIYAVAQKIEQSAASAAAGVFDPASDTVATPLRDTVRLRRTIPDLDAIPNYVRKPPSTGPETVKTFYRLQTSHENPIAPSSVNVILSNRPGEVTLTWPSRPYETYRIERSFDLVEWTSIGTANADQASAGHAIPASGEEYYRIAVQ